MSAAGPSHPGPSVVVAVDASRARALARGLAETGVDVRLVVGPSAPAEALDPGGAGADAESVHDEVARAEILVVDAGRRSLTSGLVAACDRSGTRIVALCAGAAERRLARVFGVDACGQDAAPREILAAAPAADPVPSRGRVLTVWGAAGAPGRTSVALALAWELARDGRRVALVDADAHAPSVALATGLADEGPGFAAACRQADRGTLTPAELTRIAVPLGGIEVLTGINRPSRWPELAHGRVVAALERCRDWAEDVVVDVSSSLERDEEIVSDLEGPRRNAATLAALQAADVVVGVAAADPVGIARFVRAHAELRAVIGVTPVHVVVNKVRSSALGLAPRGQVRRTLERYADAREVWFVPWDPKAADAALLAAQPVGAVAARSPFAGAVRRFVGEAIEPPPVVRARSAAVGAERTGSVRRRAARTPPRTRRPSRAQ